MLDSHPMLAIPPETHFAGQVIEAFEASEDGVDGAVRKMVGSPRWPDFGIPAGDFADTVASMHPIGPGPLLRAFYETYARRFGKPRWGDKTPPYLDRMTSIQAVLPEARFVHVIRDGRDVALSVVPLWFGPDGVAEAARQWSARIATARRQAQQLSGYLELRYEDLVGDSASSLRRVCDFLDLPWDPSMLDYPLRAKGRLAEVARDIRWRDGRTIPASSRTGIHELATQPPRRDRLRKWRSEMSASDCLAFELIAGDILGDLGYETATGRVFRMGGAEPVSSAPLLGRAQQGPPIIQYWHSESVPDYIADLLQSFDDLNPDLGHLVFSAPEAEEFIAERFTVREVAAFRACAVPAMQADYFRYCAVLALGGIYADADFRCLAGLRPLLPPSGGGCLFRSRRGNIMNGAFAFGSGGHRFLELALEIATANIERRLCDSVNFVTGPPIFITLAALGVCGSFDKLIARSAGTPLGKFAGPYCEAIGNYDRVAAAIEGVTVAMSMDAFFRHEIELPYKRSNTYWANAKGKIFT